MARVVGLTENQRATLVAIREHITQHGYPPTHRELASIFGVTLRAVVGRLVALERKGFLRRVPNVARGLVLRHVDDGGS